VIGRKFFVGRIYRGGRNNSGKLVIRGRVGGCKRRYGMVDFRRLLGGVEGKVIGFINDGGRNSGVMSVLYSSGLVSLVLRPDGIKVGDRIGNEGLGFNGKFRVGEMIFSDMVKKGMFCYGVEFGKLVRAGGSYGQVIRVVRGRILLKLSSGRVMLVSRKSGLCVGKVYFNGYESMYKAGRSRWLGRGSKVRGVAMNPVDHPHGGATAGGRCSVSSTGVFSKCGGNRKRVKGVRIDKYYE
jgi:large subunit ribosomal protein L2